MRLCKQISVTIRSILNHNIPTASLSSVGKHQDGISPNYIKLHGQTHQEGFLTLTIFAAVTLFVAEIHSFTTGEIMKRGVPNRQPVIE